MHRIASIRYAASALSAAALAASLFAQASSASATAQSSPSSPATEEETVVLSPFQVTAEASLGYKVSTASTATRTNTPIIDIPQTVDIITSEFWQDQDATNFDESFKYVANVYVRNRYAGNGDGVNLRGFETNGSIIVDGVRMGNNKRDMIGYERLEIVKGPPSAVQGRAGGTGLLNYIMKKPEIGPDTNSLKFNYSFDQFDSNISRVEFDSNITPQESKKFAVRAAGFWTDGDTYIKFQKVKSYGIYPSFKWQIAPKTDLVLATELLNLNTPSREEGHGFAVYGVKARRLIDIFNYPTEPITALGLPYDFNIAGPDSWDKDKVADTTLFFTHQHADWLFFRQVVNLRYFNYDQFYYTGEDNTKTVINSASQAARGWRHGQTYQGDVMAKFSLRDWVSGLTMVGYQYDDNTQADSTYNGVPNAPFNTLSLVAIKAAGYSASFYAGRTPNLPQTSWTNARSYSLGDFAQQDLGFFKDRLLLTGALRSDHSVTGTQNALTGVLSSSSSTTLQSYRYGVTYKITPSLAVYAVKSLQNDPPATSHLYNGLIAGDPRLNEFITVTPQESLKEAGVKGELFKGRLSFTVDYWEMVKFGSTINTLANGVSQGQNVTFGTVTVLNGAQSKGWEMSAYGGITERLAIIANYTNMTTSQAFTGQQNSLGWTTASNPGRIPLRFAPDWNANLFLKYSFRDKKEQGWEAQVTGYGLSRVSVSQSSYDLGASYTWKKYNFDVMVTNLTNAPFMITRDQAPRTFRFSVSTQF